MALLLVLAHYPSKPLPAGTSIDRLVVYKSERKMEAYSQGTCIKTYYIALGRKPVGDKQFEGDKKTPEGLYTINDKNLNSAYYKNLGISYPNANDCAEAKRLGKAVGGDIKIHGLRNGLGWLGRWHRLSDWTLGCIAVTNTEMEELYMAVPAATTIEIYP